MTKRIIGLILAIAAIAVIVIAAIRHNTYTSMIGPAATEMPAPEKTGQKKPAPETLRADSLTAAKPDTVRQTGGHAGPEHAGPDMQSDLCTVHAKKLRSNSRIEIPGTANLCRGFRLEGFRCFSKTLLLRHRPASYGRIVVGVSKRISPLSLKHSALLIFLSHLIIILVTRIVRRSRILRRDGENTAIRPVIERNFHPLYCIRTW